MNTIRLTDCREIAELLDVLEQNGLHQQKEDVQSLVTYIQRAEQTLEMVRTELAAVRSEIHQMHDSLTRTKCTQIALKAAKNMQRISAAAAAVKRNLLSGAENALTTFRRKGKLALVQALDAMQVPSLMDGLRRCFQRGASAMTASAKRLDDIRSTLHRAGGHLQNAGRALTGKLEKECEALEADKGTLAKLCSFLETCGGTFARMACGAEKTASRIQRAKTTSAEQKQSVKAELNLLKRTRKNGEKHPGKQEPVR